MPKAKSKAKAKMEEKPEEQQMMETPVVETPVEEKPVEQKPEKKKRAPSAYNLFVKEHMKNFAHLPPKERMSEVAKLYKESKKKS